MASKIFITGTDTDAGKTWVTASAVRSLLQQNRSVRALKPVACGLDTDGRNEDIETLLHAQGLQNPDDICLYQFAKPAAPSQAAAEEGGQVAPQQLVHWCEEKSSDVEITLIEGVGGLMVPITDNWLVSDWIQAMPDAEVWLVIACKLGAINQTLLTLDKLKQIGRTPSRIFFNAAGNTSDTWIKPTLEAAQPFLTTNCIIQEISYGQHPEIDFDN
ncbi:dethiobiotin synthetase [Mariprofundus micogutta]|uniref:ATP-dependent dethiobiotin synthetase BioD n=1 Tax=Mariprofundus micogutta TaxID=1921010 RepID=A0A1L8CQ23_9PROT|nr:dethiobiotin synthase [Mariprofundus micogutta]GAV21030.1 dethiobiotin synthetase [Mariprofundus micogutta]